MTEPVSILLVDDQRPNLDALESILESPEYRLVRAMSAEEALLALIDGSFAAIVLDVCMPGMGGLELAQMIQQRKRTQNVPLLFLTAHLHDETDILSAYGAGAVDYLTKPINPDILRSKISVFARLHRATEALASANALLADEIARRLAAEQDLRIANETLEERVRQRTADLLLANESLRESQAQVEAFARDAEAANKAKDHFLAVLSHELRTPLTPVLATVERLERTAADDPDLREALATIHRNVELEARLIDDLLDLTRAARGKFQLARQAVDVNVLLRQAVDICFHEAAAKGVELILSTAPVPPRTLGDPARLQQVFWNLIRNAVSFTPRGGVIAASCHRSDAADGEWIVVEIRDTGEGIEPEALQTIFEPFVQGNRSTRIAGGMGLGLAICRSLVDLHCGTIVADSPGPGRGATFTVRLPVLAADHSPRPPSEAGGSLAGIRVLLVEDHPDSARALAALLQLKGMNVRHAATVAEARRELGQMEFDLLISDLGLPDGTGYDLMRSTAANGALAGIALSGYGMDLDLAASRQAGFAAHLVKPVTVDELYAAVSRVLAARGSREPALSQP